MPRTVAPATPDTSEPDRQLMVRYQAGDLGAFDELYRRHAPRLLGFLLRKLAAIRPPEAASAAAEDALQAVFFKFHRLRHRYDPRFEVLHWLFVIARSAALDTLKARARHPELSESQSKEAELALSQTPAPPEQENTASESEPAAQNWLKQLNPKQREIVQLRVLDELTYDEIARRLGKSEVSIRQQVSRALRKLKELATGKKAKKSPSPHQGASL